MPKSLLLTSFDVWKSHHQSNASDDLVAELLQRQLWPEPLHLLRKLPVDFELAPAQVIATIAQVRPDMVVCCGMAERRSRLSVESNGKQAEEILPTGVNVRQLVKGLPMTRVSHHAGKFVCNHTYYSVLNYLRESNLSCQSVFVHVPVLTEENRGAIVQDFATLLRRLMML